jgi:ribosomal protein S18 acetylase RimI-like enzyme
VVVIIRRARLADARAVGEITRTVYVDGGYADPATAPGYVAELSDGEGRIRGATVFVAESQGRIVGTVTAVAAGSGFSNIARPQELEVRMLAVTAAARGQGAASGLMTACERLAVEGECEAVVLSTDPDMRAAQRLYAQRGYVRTPERDWPADGIPLWTYGLALPGKPAATTDSGIGSPPH